MNKNIREVPKSIRPLKKEVIELTPPELLFRDFNFETDFPFADESELDLPILEDLLNENKLPNEINSLGALKINKISSVPVSTSKKQAVKKLPSIDNKKTDSKIKKKN